MFLTQLALDCSIVIPSPAWVSYAPQANLLGRVVEWIDGDAGWRIVDQVAMKYTGAAYPREQERVVAMIWPEVLAPYCGS